MLRIDRLLNSFEEERKTPIFWSQSCIHPPLNTRLRIECFRRPTGSVPSLSIESDQLGLCFTRSFTTRHNVSLCSSWKGLAMFFQCIDSSQETASFLVQRNYLTSSFSQFCLTSFLSFLNYSIRLTACNEQVVAIDLTESEPALCFSLLSALDL